MKHLKRLAVGLVWIAVVVILVFSVAGLFLFMLMQGTKLEIAAIIAVGVIIYAYVLGAIIE